MAPKVAMKKAMATAKAAMKKTATKTAMKSAMKKAAAMKTVMKKQPAAMKVMKKAAKAPKKTVMKKQKAVTRIARKVKVDVAEPIDALKNLKALILGLERRPDRKDRALAMLSKQVPWLQVEYFPATDGKFNKPYPILDSEVSKTWNTKFNAKYCDDYEDMKAPDGTILHKAAEFTDPGVIYEFSPGERGCAHSHYRMWKRVVEEGRPMLILEDDVELVFEREDGSMAGGNTFTAQFNLGYAEAEQRGADVLYLGWSGHREGHYMFHKDAAGHKKGKAIRKAEYVWTTVAYVLWPAGAEKLLQAAQPLNQPVDNFMACEAANFRLNSYVLLDKKDTNSTWAGGIASQVDFNGDSDIKKSDGGDQGDDPTEFLVGKA